MPDIKRRTLPWIEVRTDDEAGEIEGCASYYGKIDAYGSILGPGGFRDSLPWFLKNGIVEGMNHDWDWPLGKPKAASESTRGLEVRGSIEDTSYGRDVKVLLKSEVIQYMSIAFQPLVRKYLETEALVREYWDSISYVPDDEDNEKCKYGAVVYEKSKLYGFCPVTFPANFGARIEAVRSGEAPAGLQLGDQMTGVLANLSVLRERLEGIAELRNSKGGDLSFSSKIGLKGIESELSAIRALLAPTTDSAEGLAVRAMAEASIAQAGALVALGI